MRWLDCLNCWANIERLRIVSEIGFNSYCCSCVLTTTTTTCLEWTRVGWWAETTWLMAITITITINAVNNVFSALDCRHLEHNVAIHCFQSYSCNLQVWQGVRAHTNIRINGTTTCWNQHDFLRFLCNVATFPRHKSYARSRSLVHQTHPPHFLFPWNRWIYCQICLRFISSLLSILSLFYRFRSFICPTFSFHAYQESRAQCVPCRKWKCFWFLHRY